MVVLLVLHRRRVVSYSWVLFYRLLERRPVAPSEPPKELGGGDPEDQLPATGGANVRQAAAGAAGSQELRAGDRVGIFGLARRADLNGVEGSALRLEDDRWVVGYVGGEIRVRSENLVVLRPPAPRPRPRARLAQHASEDSLSCAKKPRPLGKKKPRGRRAASEQEMHRLTEEDGG